MTYPIGILENQYKHDVLNIIQLRSIVHENMIKELIKMARGLKEAINILNSLPKEETRSVAHNKQTEKSCHVDIKAGIDCSGMCLINHCKWFY